MKKNLLDKQCVRTIELDDHLEEQSAKTSDPRHALIRDYIFQGYHQCLQLEVAPPWNGRDGKALKKLLDDNPSWTVDFLKKLIKNKFYSDEPVGPAWEWLPKLFRYAEGSLDRYGKLGPMRGSATAGMR